MKRRLFQWFTVGVLFCCLGGIYANIIVDDGPVRVQALETLRTAAGCGAAPCKLEQFRGERGMIQERLEYDVVGKGHWTVVCRRALIIAGEYTCKASGPEKR